MILTHPVQHAGPRLAGHQLVGLIVGIGDHPLALHLLHVPGQLAGCALLGAVVVEPYQLIILLNTS